MAKFTVLSDLIEALAQHKRDVITSAQIAWRLCDFSLAEPEIIKSFTMSSGKGVDYLNRTLATDFNNAQTRFVLKFAGVYAHQRPYVFRDAANSSVHAGTNKTERCELADMAFLAVCVDQEKTVIAARASFFQAKKGEAIDNETQRWLYDYDDKFKYQASSFWEHAACNSPDRTMPDWDEGRTSAFQYLILSETHNAHVRLSPWNVCHRHAFGFFLYRLLTFAGGKDYRASEITAGGWSSIVNDVLRMGNGAMSGVDRGSVDLDTIIDYFNDFRDHTVQNYDSRSSEGFPIVIAIVQDVGQSGA
ncbi:hypothetical protein N5J06_19980 [Ralstonia sp. CHL-2022]|uniref:Uncharacterized protein n=1 Tax=Ralstonia mojiangensis TaxID=2953895 RepID=A0ABT2LDJ7_9RALS|nr:hypothetical protein [Ralstonia mojiangensis]MCT7313259.1 hypothetical protein [Ralstonia mojiangensis]